MDRNDVAADELIDRDACMGSGNCVFWAPAVFDLDEDGVAVVRGELERARRRSTDRCQKLPDLGDPDRPVLPDECGMTASYNHTGLVGHRPRALQALLSRGVRVRLLVRDQAPRRDDRQLGLARRRHCEDGVLSDPRRFVLELMHYAAPGATAPFRTRTMNEPGLTHLSLSVDDVQATAARVVEFGGQVIEESASVARCSFGTPTGS